MGRKEEESLRLGGARAEFGLRVMVRAVSLDPVAFGVGSPSMEETNYVLRHVNPVELARDSLEVAGIYLESVIIVWFILACALLLGVNQGFRNPIRTLSGRTTKQRAEAALGEITKAYDTNVREQRPYELFNGRLAMLGTAFAFVGDYKTGGLGPLEQVQKEIGIPVIDEEIFAVVFLSGVAFSVVSTGVTAFRRAYAQGRE